MVTISNARGLLLALALTAFAAVVGCTDGGTRYVLKWRENNSKPWMIYEVRQDKGLAAVNGWLQDNEEAVLASRVGEGLAVVSWPLPELFELKNGQAKWIPLMTGVPVDPTKAVNETAWVATGLTDAQLETLKGLFLTYGVANSDVVLPRLHSDD